LFFDYSQFGIPGLLDIQQDLRNCTTSDAQHRQLHHGCALLLWMRADFATSVTGFKYLRGKRNTRRTVHHEGTIVSVVGAGR